MAELTDHELLTQYARTGAEAPFATLVTRHINLVYSAARRYAGDDTLAADITQAVFILLARKAGSIGARTVLSGWLYQTARLTAANALKEKIRREKRDHQAYMESKFAEDDLSRQSEATAEAWKQLAPVLDDAMNALREADRNAVLLRYFENKPLAEVGAALGVSEDAARVRVNRALEKLRAVLTKQGVTLGVKAVAGAIGTSSVQAAPVGMAVKISVVAGKGTAATGSVTTLVKGVLKIMAWSKAKIAIVVGAGILFAAGTATVAVKTVEAHRLYPWQNPKADFTLLYDSAPQVKIVPTKFPSGGFYVCDGRRAALGISVTLQDIMEVAYNKNDMQTVVIGDISTNRYDFIAKLVPARVPHRVTPTDTNWVVELKKQISKQFNYKCSLEMRDADVLVLKPSMSGIRSVKVSHQMPNGIAVKPIVKGVAGGMLAGFEYHQQPMSTLVNFLEQNLKLPVIDQTGLTNNYDFSVSWIQKVESDKNNSIKLPDLETAKKVLSDQLGIELIAARQPIEMLAIRNAH
jgi:uncharacterized protein (TIGR03435 family)